MEHFVERVTDKIQLDDTTYIEILRRMGIGDYDHVDWLETNASIGRTLALLETNIIGWNRERDGKLVQVTRGTISELEQADALKILTEILTRNKTSTKKV